MGACLTSPTSTASQRAACGKLPGDVSERCRKRLSTYFAVMKSSCMVTGSMSVTVIHGLPPHYCKVVPTERLVANRYMTKPVSQKHVSDVQAVKICTPLGNNPGASASFVAFGSPRKPMRSMFRGVPLPQRYHWREVSSAPGRQPPVTVRAHPGAVEDCSPEHRPCADLILSKRATGLPRGWTLL